MGVLVRIWEFSLRVCSSAERPLHFIKLQLRVPEGAVYLALTILCPVDSIVWTSQVSSMSPRSLTFSVRISDAMPVRK